ncbi:hypothetical protein BJY04DRAFT_158817 [Aspergillus karnatakaensis]|uniref:uncharacterized protein n=1 Tax=Aspergillus karnatakaensis TaxID=1810916 RepID=UPI003CCDB8D1
MIIASLIVCLHLTVSVTVRLILFSSNHPWATLSCIFYSYPLTMQPPIYSQSREYHHFLPGQGELYCTTTM